MIDATYVLQLATLKQHTHNKYTIDSLDTNNCPQYRQAINALPMNNYRDPLYQGNGISLLLSLLVIEYQRMGY